MGTDWVAPTFTGIFLLLGAAVTAIASIVVSRRNGDASKTPTVEQLWRETERARSREWAVVQLYRVLRSAFKGYARRMTERHGEDSAALTDQERAAIAADVPDPE